MEVPPVKGGAQTPAPVAQASTRGGDALAPGARLVVRVASVEGSHVLLEAGDRTFAAESTVPLQPGRILTVEVASTQPIYELRVLGSPPDVSELDYALATLRVAGQALGAAAQPGDRSRNDLAGDAFSALAGRPELALRSGARAAIASLTKLLAPCTADETSAVIAERLRGLVENGGALFEARLRAALDGAAQGTGPAARPHLPDVVSGDARALLGRLAAALGLRPDADPTTGSAGGPSPLRDAFDRAVSTVLLRQVEVAHAWVESGTLLLQIPLALEGTTTTAELRVTPDEERADRERGSRRGAFQVLLALPQVGRLGVWVQWAGSDLRAQVAVEDGVARALVEPHVSSLADGLRSAGFRTVTAQLAVDPARIAAATAPFPDPAPPPGGSILDARA